MQIFQSQAQAQDKLSSAHMGVGMIGREPGQTIQWFRAVVLLFRFQVEV